MGDRTPAAFRTIEDLAGRVGQCCWVERRLFELTGRWASEAGDPAARVLFSEMASHHAGLAVRWRERLPIRAGVDADGLVVPPGGGAQGALAMLEAEPELIRKLAGLVNVLLPRILADYENMKTAASPVREAPVRVVLEAAEVGGRKEVTRGTGILQQRLQDEEVAWSRAEFCREIERPFGDDLGIFPAVWAS